PPPGEFSVPTPELKPDPPLKITGGSTPYQQPDNTHHVSIDITGTQTPGDSPKGCPGCYQGAGGGKGPPFTPGGQTAVPMINDPLDPKGLNGPLSLGEQQQIANTLSLLATGSSAEVLTLRPHAY